MMSPWVGHAALAATFVGGISGLWYLWEQWARIFLKMRVKYSTQEPRSLARRLSNFSGSVCIAAVLGMILCLLFASDTDSPYPVAYYLASAFAAGALQVASRINRKPTLLQSILRHSAGGLLAGSTSVLVAALVMAPLMPRGVVALQRLLTINIFFLHGALPHYAVLGIGFLSGTVGGLAAIRGSGLMRVADSICTSLIVILLLTVAGLAIYVYGDVGVAAFFLLGVVIITSVVVMFYFE